MQVTAALLLLHMGGAVFGGGVFADPPHAPASIDRNLLSAFSQAKVFLSAGRTTEGLARLQEILSSSSENLLLLDGRYVDEKHEANRILAESPSSVREAYERQFGELALRELARAEATGRVEELLRVARSYRHTRAGGRALAASASLLFDTGRFLEAGTAARELLKSNPRFADRFTVSTQLVLSWLQLGETDRARQWIDGHRASLGRQTVSSQGHSMRLDQWLDLVAHTVITPVRLVPQATGGHPQTTPAIAIRQPATQAIWTSRLGPTGEVGSLVAEAMSRHVQYGVAPIPQEVPLVVGQTLVVRRVDELAAYDAKTGKRRWSRNLSPTGANLEDSPNLLQNESFVPVVMDAHVDRILTGGAHSALSTNGDRVFSVVEDVAASSNRFHRRRRFAIESPPKNSLAAFDVKNGDEVWRISEMSLPGPGVATEDASRDVDFLGPPLVCGDSLFVLGRTDDGPLLLVLNPSNGSLRWSLSFVGFAGFDADAFALFGPACIPVEKDGLLICPTPGGTILAVDLLTRTCRWVYRCEPTEEPTRLPGRMGRAFPRMNAAWMSGWREAVVRLNGDRCLIVVPRCPAIHVLDVGTGVRVWSRSVPSGQFLGPIVNGRLLAVAKYQVLGFDAADGRPLWQTPIGLPAGRGLAVREKYYLPQTDGGIAVIDIVNGTATFCPVQDSPGFGNLMPIGQPGNVGVAASLTHDQLVLLPDLEARRAELTRRLVTTPKDGEVLRELAMLDREAGDFQNAERHLRDRAALRRAQPAEDAESAKHPVHAAALVVKELPDPDPAEVALRELCDTLRFDLEVNPKRCDTIAPELVGGLNDPQQKALALRSIARARLRNGERLRALDVSLQLVTKELPASIVSERGPRRVVAFQQQLRADLDDLFQACSATERAEANSRVNAFAKKILADANTVVLRRALQRLPETNWDPDGREKVEIALRPEPGFLRAHLEAWAATTSDNIQRGAEGWRTLAELYRDHGNRAFAAACYRRLESDFRSVKLQKGGTAARVVAEARGADPRLAAAMDHFRADLWPRALPKTASDIGEESPGSFLQLPMEVLAGSLGERLDVGVDRDGKTLRFQGADQTSYWNLALPAPESPSFRTNYALDRAWSVGHLLIVQVGTDLFGVAPLDEEGEPAAKLLWHLDMLGESRTNAYDLAVRPMVPGLGLDRLYLTDRFGRPVARVGPVGPGYVCYQDRGTLVALDPLTRGVLWRRADIGMCDLVSGDETRIVLVDRRHQRVSSLRALDGKRMMEDASEPTVANLRWLEGRDGVIQTAKERRTFLSRIDLATRKIQWRRDFPSGAQCVRLDGCRFVAVGSDGILEVVAASSGETLASHPIAGAGHSLQVYATSDERRFYLAFSHPFSDPDNFRANGQREDPRNPLVNGVLCALDRGSNQLLWVRPLQDGKFAIDQSRVAPFLVFSYRHGVADEAESGGAWPYLHCIDKRTGRDVCFERLTAAQPASRIFAEANLNRREVVIRLPEGGIRFRYPRP